MRVTEQFVDAGDGHRLFVQIAGAGAPVVVPMTSGNELAALSGSYRLVLYDARGRGRSKAAGAGRVTFEADVADLERLRAALDLPAMSLIGWSYFGAVAARYAMDHPGRVARLVLVATIPLRHAHAAAIRQAQAERLHRTTPRLMARVKEGVRLTPAELRAIAYAMVLTRCGRQPPWPGDAGGRFLEAFLGTDTERRGYFSSITQAIATMGEWDWRTEATNIACPTLVIYGAGDLLAGEMCAEWVQAIPASRGLVLEAAGHFPSLEAPELFFPVVDAFLAGGWPDHALVAAMPKRSTEATERVTDGTGSHGDAEKRRQLADASTR